MSDSYVRNVVEAALLAAQRPVTLPELVQLFEESSRPDSKTVRAALDVLANDYRGRGIEVRETASGFRVQVRNEFAAEIARLWPERPQRYTRALLETLALIAYRQPITRAEIEQVRGVAVNSNIVATLMERGWIRVVGHRDVPGHPEVLGTTKEFLDYFSLKSIDELPPLAELKEIAELNLQLDLSGVGDSAEVPASTATARPPASNPGLDAAGDDVGYGDAAVGDEDLADDDDAPAEARTASGLVAAPPTHDD
ncbi:MAG: SMC-Scp complex subunit ScpB [Steroidobacteraceae bacterium]|nr:SMC-Scp complex subunit ScpB [Steroidobacteraceae bacterium]